MGIIMKKIRYFLFLGFILSYLSPILGQNSQKSQRIFQRNDGKFYRHIVEKGNTLYGISRQYEVSIVEIKKENPKVKEGLSIGDTIWIALKHVEKANAQTPNSNYLIYKVRDNNTLYSISKEYGVEIKDIVLANPALQDGLKVGMELKIPLAGIREEPVSKIPEKFLLKEKYETHLVQPKETLYSLSRQYNVEIDSILKLNAGLEQGLKIGQEIIIPLPRADTSLSIPGIELKFDSSNLKKSYKIAILLPFYLDKIQVPTDSTDVGFLENKELVYKHAKYGIELYEGFMLALDSIQENGLSADIYVHDVANDSAKLAAILSKPQMKEMDLIIGPLFYNKFMAASAFAKENKIHIVSPVKQSNKILLGNEFVSKVVSSDPVLIKSLAELVVDSLGNENVIVVYSDNIKERINLEQFNSAYSEASKKLKDSSFYRDSAKWSRPPVIFQWENNDSFNSLKSKLLPDSLSDKKNYVLVLSDNQAMVTQLLTSLNLISQKYDITVIGREDWESYSNLDVDYLHALNVHLVLPEFINQQDTDVQAFQNKFYKTYKTLPGRFAYVGYDVGFYYLTLLNRFGKNINYMIDRYHLPMLSRSFDFSKTGIESGYENHSFNLVKYENYGLKKVR